MQGIMLPAFEHMPFRQAWACILAFSAVHGVRMCMQGCPHGLLHGMALGACGLAVAALMDWLDRLRWLHGPGAKPAAGM